MTSSGKELESAIEACHAHCQRILEEVNCWVIGRRSLIEQLLIAFLARGHVLIEGVPGIGKSLIVQILAKISQGLFREIQLTPDLAPLDLLGREVIVEDLTSAQRRPQLEPGPLFANFLVARDINRTLPKIQALILDALEGGLVSVGSKLHNLPRPFFVLATQNPLHPEDTYPLHEAQLDRFLFFLKADYPSGAEEWEVAKRAAGAVEEVPPLVTLEEWSGYQELVDRISMEDSVLGYAWALVRASRPRAPDSPEFVDRWVAWGASTRGLIALVRAVKARALLYGRAAAQKEDVYAMAKYVLRHRIAPNEVALAQALTSDRLVEMIMESVPQDQSYAPPEGAKLLKR